MTDEELKQLAESIHASEPGELWDVYDAAGRPTGGTRRRGEALEEGEYHLCVHVWIRDEAGRCLLTKRAPGKYMAGRWEAPGGSALTGEDSLAAALREVKEETGLDVEHVRYYKSQPWGIVDDLLAGFYCDVWRFTQAVELSEVRLLPGETADARRATAEEIRALEREGGLFSFDYLPRVLEG